MKTSKFSTSTAPTVPYAKTTEVLNTLFPTSKRPIVTYPTVSPESVVIPIVTCIFGFPLVAFIVICCLRKRAKLARERDRLNYGLQEHAVSLVRFSPIHGLTSGRKRTVSLSSVSMSRGYPSIELDTVFEEKSDPEQTQTEVLMSPESPKDFPVFLDS